MTPPEICDSTSRLRSKPKKQNVRADSLTWENECFGPKLEFCPAEKNFLNPNLSSRVELLLGEARQMLDLPADWDDDGAEKITKETLDRAAQFLSRTIEDLQKEGRTAIQLPRLSPWPDGSIDLHWKNAQFELLLNIPASGVGDFYGDTADGLKVKGSFIPEVHNQGIICWLLSNG